MERKIKAIKINTAACTADVRVYAELDDGSTVDLPCLRVEILLDAETQTTRAGVVLAARCADLGIDIPIEAATIKVQP